MKKLIIKLIIISLVPAVFFYWLEFNLARVPNSYSFKLKRLTDNFTNIQTLVFGSSHGLHGVNPEFFEKPGLNMANNSQSLTLDFQITEKYLEKMPNIRSVIYILSYFSLRYSLFETTESWRIGFYNRYFGVLGEQPWYYIFNPSNYLLSLIYPSNQLRDLLRIKFKLDYSAGINSFGTAIDFSNDKSKISNELGKSRVLYHESLMKPESMRNNLVQFNNLIENLISRKIKIYFISPPVYNTYYNNINLNIFNEDIGEISKFIDNKNVFYFNFMDDKRFVVEDFLDNDHLNSTGSKKFSEIINESILKKLD